MTKIPKLNEIDKLQFHNIHAFRDYKQDLDKYLKGGKIILGGDILEHDENSGYSCCGCLNWYYNGRDVEQSYKIALDYLQSLVPLSYKKTLFVEYVIA